MCQLPYLGEKDPALGRHPEALGGGLRGGLGGCYGHALAHLVVGQREVTCGEVATGLWVEQRLLDRAYLLALPAARVEAAGLWRPRRARHVAAEDLPLALKSRLRHRHG